MKKASSITLFLSLFAAQQSLGCPVSLVDLAMHLPIITAEKYALVFKGSVIASNEGAAAVQMQVRNSWKGEAKGTINLTSTEGLCRPEFELGNEYVVFAVEEEGNDPQVAVAVPISLAVNGLIEHLDGLSVAPPTVLRAPPSNRSVCKGRHRILGSALIAYALRGSGDVNENSDYKIVQLESDSPYHESAATSALREYLAEHNPGQGRALVHIACD